MKNIKRITLLCVCMCMTVLLSGCVGLGDILFGLLGTGSSDASSSQPEAVSSFAKPKEVASSLPAVSASAPSQPAPPEESVPLLSLNKDVVAFIGKTNGDVRAVNGEVCYTYILYGGAPVADYINRSVPYPFAFWVGMDQEAMMDLWMEVSDGEGTGPQANIWPDNAVVGLIEAGEEAIPLLFNTTHPEVSYDMLKAAFGQAPELDFTAAYEGVDYSYTIDTWAATYEIDGLTMETVFEKSGNEHVLMNVRLFPAIG